MKAKGDKYTFDELAAIIARLRAPDGCPWDREQTHESIKKNLVEEAYELVEAIDGGRAEKIADESGDVLMQVLLHAQIGKDNGEYDISDVIDVLSRKLIHRHPHVFGDISIEKSEDVLNKWDEIKRADRAQMTIAEEMRGVSSYLPALMRAQKIQKKAKRAGYDPVSDKPEAAAEEELGKLLFAVVAACNDSGVDPEIALSGYLTRFISEFEEFEKNN